MDFNMYMYDDVETIIEYTKYLSRQWNIEM